MRIDIKSAQMLILSMAFIFFAKAQINDGPSFYKIKSSANKRVVSDAQSLFKEHLPLMEHDHMIFLETRISDEEFRQDKYQQYYKGLKVEHAIYNINYNHGVAESISGEFYSLKDIHAIPLLSESEALKKALAYVNAKIYAWEVSSEEMWLKGQKSSPDVSFYPKGELLISRSLINTNDNAPLFCLAYKFDVYAKEPLSRSYIYVNAQDGRIILQNAIIKHANAIAQTRFSGTRTIGTEQIGNSYRLRDLTRGNGIETYNLNNGTNYSSATDFTDNDNNWTSEEHANLKKDNAALDAHWGASMTYDYFKNIHGRNSYDGKGSKIKNYVHYSTNYVNAFWDGNGISYGDGGVDKKGNQRDPFTALDITAHEIGHGVCESTAGLIYLDEPGALNEGLSDIWGATVKHYTDPTKSTWTIGEDTRSVLRSMSDPNKYEHPDTYKGQFWQTGGDDNGGVHTNSGVLNHWYYILAMGKTGVNDNGHNYSIKGIGIDKAARIVYRLESVYLTATSGYGFARNFSIMAAIDLYGEESDEALQTEKAWNAVGVYEKLISPGRLSAIVISATQVDLSWMDNSYNETGFSIERSPDPDGNYTKVATVDRNVRNYRDLNITSGNNYYYRIRALKNEELKSTYSNVAIAMVGSSPIIMSTGSIITCDASFLDPGGSGNYINKNDYYLNIKPSVKGHKIKVSFSEFNLNPKDKLEIYDGSYSINDYDSPPLIGSYNSMPPLLYATNPLGELTFVIYKESSDAINTYSGWQAKINCVESIPPSDLVLSASGITTTPLSPESPFDFSCTISNAVNETLAEGCEISLYLSKDDKLDSGDQPLGAYYVPYLAGNTSVNRKVSSKIPANTTPGRYYVFAAVDPKNLVAETNELNNSGSIAVTIVNPTQDLVILSSAIGNDILPGVKFSTSCSISNEGVLAASSSQIGYYLSSDTTWDASDIFLSISFVDELQGNTTITKTSELMIPAKTILGQYYLLFVADYLNAVVESNESNNVAYKLINIKDPTGIEEIPVINNEEVSIYPNPGNGNFNVKVRRGSYDSNKIEVILLNVLGEVLEEKTSIVDSATLSSNISFNGYSGTFILKMRINKNFYFKRLLIH